MNTFDIKTTKLSNFITKVTTNTEHLQLLATQSNFIDFYDFNLNNTKNTLTIESKIISMDSVNNNLVVLTTDNILLYDLRNLKYSIIKSSLKHMNRTVKCNPEGTGFVYGNIDGRVAVDWFLNETDNKKYAFKCHRKIEENEELVYPVNCIDFHPVYT